MCREPRAIFAVVEHTIFASPPKPDIRADHDGLARTEAAIAVNYVTQGWQHLGYAFAVGD